MSHGSYYLNLGSKRLILVRDIRPRSWPNIDDSYGMRNYFFFKFRPLQLKIRWRHLRMPLLHRYAFFLLQRTVWQKPNNRILAIYRCTSKIRWISDFWVFFFRLSCMSTPERIKKNSDAAVLRTPNPNETMKANSIVLKFCVVFFDAKV